MSVWDHVQKMLYTVLIIAVLAGTLVGFTAVLAISYFSDPAQCTEVES